MRPLRYLPLAALAAFCIGSCCSPSTGETGLNLWVRDALTKAFVCDADVRFEDQDDHWTMVADNRPLPDASCTYLGAYERAGRYRITIERRGYEMLKLDDVEVDDDSCGIEGRVLNLDLERDPNAPPEAFEPLDAGADTGTDAP